MNAPARKYFTVEEANHSLPLVRAIVGDIVKKFAEVSERKERLEQIRKSHGKRERRRDDPYAEELAHTEAELEKEIASLQGYVEELEGLGVELKDVSKGLVDFRSLMDGREIYLCWHLGEDEVAFWHELDAGFAGRQSLLAGSASPGADESSVDGEP